MSKGKDSKKKKAELTTKRTVAKYGMAVSMGTLVASGFIDSRNARKVHILAGVSLVGFSLWHYSLYPSEKIKKKKV
ncbi:MAG: hypothetical protein CSA18_04270 [Deltaproteobacteria bacterium]|nr:MAG: hypothetical protein CSA18_04270 [Deltaproteobacteria bacterium]